jgi:pyruvate-formate lyase
MTDDCIAKGRTVMDKGARYLGGLIESFGITSLADSLYAIKELVYDKKVLTLEKLVTILDANFEGYEKERQMMLNLPKFGNDEDCVDDIHSELTRFINEDVNEKGKAAGLDYFLICNLNPGGVSYAHNTKATADGRRYGDTMSIGNAPTPGHDKNGLTALLNSMKKHDKHHAGFVHNVKVSKQLLTGKNRSKFESMVKTYFKEGGVQLMVTALDVNDLKNAMETPEKYPNLLVRVGGWTARFVELQPVYQLENIQRTMYQ